MANKHKEKCSTSLIIREIQIKFTMRYHFTHARLAIIQKTANSKRWQGCEEIRTLIYHWLKCKMFQPLRKTVWQFLQWLNLELPYDLAILVLGIYTQEK